MHDSKAVATRPFCLRIYSKRHVSGGVRYGDSIIARSKKSCCTLSTGGGVLRREERQTNDCLFEVVYTMYRLRFWANSFFRCPRSGVHYIPCSRLPGTEKTMRIVTTKASFSFHRLGGSAVQANIDRGGTRKALAKAEQIQEQRELWRG